jgi:hypothetical protein
LPGFGTFSLYWCCTNLLVVALAAVPCFERPKYRGSERFDTAEPIEVVLEGVRSRGNLRDLSTTGASLVVPIASHLNDGQGVTLEMKDCPPLPARVVRRVDDQAIGLRFDADDATTQALIRKLYCSDDYITPATTWSASGAWLGLFKWAFR